MNMYLISLCEQCWSLNACSVLCYMFLVNGTVLQLWRMAFLICLCFNFVFAAVGSWHSYWWLKIDKQRVGFTWVIEAALKHFFWSFLCMNTNWFLNLLIDTSVVYCFSIQGSISKSPDVQPPVAEENRDSSVSGRSPRYEGFKPRQGVVALCAHHIAFQHLGLSFDVDSPLSNHGTYRQTYL